MTPAHRLPADEVRRRKARFLMLVADGVDPEQARERAELSLLEAFRITSKPGYEAAVDAVRASGDTVAVQLSVNTSKAAA